MSNICSFSRYRYILLLFILFVCSFGYSQDEDERRLALVIGNSQYASDPLENPINDAKLISSSLEKVGFETMVFTDVKTEDDFFEAVHSFTKRLKEFDVGFVYYAGHGIEIDGVNYLIPTEVDFDSIPDRTEREAYIKRKSFEVQEMMRYLYKQKRKLNIVVLDACRVPIEGRGVSSEDPINNASIDINSGTLLAFSTRSGEVAEDGDGNNSIYCKTLAEQILIPNQHIGQIFGNVRDKVERHTKSRQSPIERSALSGSTDFYFVQDFSALPNTYIRRLTKEAEKEMVSGNIESALDKYTILKLYFQGDMQNIDKKKLRKVYLEMGHIYYSMHRSEPEKYYLENKESWTELKYKEYLRMSDEYLSHASNSFLNAKLLYENELPTNNDDKEFYSESFYKYLRCQSYLDYESGRIDNEKYMMEINNLNKYNQENFGDTDFRTACALYLKGLFVKDEDPFASYNYFVKSADIFSVNNRVKIDDLNKYALTFNHVFPYKWSIISFNSILESTLNEDNFVSKDKAREVNDYLTNNLNMDPDDIYKRNLDIINKGIEISKSDSDSDLEGLYTTATKFFHMLPIVMDVSMETYVTCSHSTIKFRNLALAENLYPTYQDSISNFNSNAVTYNNLSLQIDTSDIDSLRKVEKIVYDLYQLAFEMGVRNNDGIYALWICNKFLSGYYYDPSPSSLYNYNQIRDVLFVMDNLFTNIIKTFGCDEEAPLLDDYFTWLELLNEEDLLVEEDVISMSVSQKELYSIFFSEK